MFPHNTEYDNLSETALLEKSTHLFEIIKSEYERFQIISKAYTVKINYLLNSINDDSIDNFVSLLSEKDFLWSCEYSQDFSLLSTMQVIIPLEINNHLKPSIFSMKNLNDISECYTRVNFLFRRIEFDFPMEEQLELVPLIEKYQLTPIFLYIVLTTGLFDRKSKIAAQLSNIYTCLNQPKWAALFSQIH